MRSIDRISLLFYKLILAISALILIVASCIFLSNLLEVWTYVRTAQAWKEVDATVKEVEIVPINKSKKNHAAAVTLEYPTPEGLRWKRLIPTYDKDSFLSQPGYSDFEIHQSGKTPIKLLVNRDNPMEILLVKKIRVNKLKRGIGLFLAIAALCIGFCYFSVKSIRRVKTIVKLKQLYPQEPWRHIPEWQQESLRPFTNRVDPLIVSILFFIPCLFFAFWMDGRLPLFPFVIFSIVWVLIIAIGSNALYYRWRNSRARLHLKTFPGRPGKELSGEVLLGRTLPHEEHLTVSLHKYRNVWVPRGERSRLITSLAWSAHLESAVKEGVLSGSLVGREHKIIFSFSLPQEAEDSGNSDSGRSPFFTWYLEVTSKHRKGHHWVKFEIPVFREGTCNSGHGLKFM